MNNELLFLRPRYYPGKEAVVLFEASEILCSPYLRYINNGPMH